MVTRFLRRHPLLTGGALLGAAVGIGTAIDSRLDPAAWQPPEAPDLTGPLASDGALTGCETVVTCDGPEDVAFDDEGRLYTGVADGTVQRTVDPVDAETTEAALEEFAQVGGRPLALEFDGDDLVVCAEDAGLVSVDPDGDVESLARTAGGRHIAFADDLHVAADGTIYFSDATEHDQFSDELFELRDTGRLLAYHPDSDETTVELEDLGFANGVELGPNGESLLVTETARYRITRYWHRGDRAGESETFVENLPGFPDNVDAAGDGTYWVAIPARRDDMLDTLHEHPWIVRQLGKLPASVLELSGDPYGLVLRVDADGEVVDSLHDPIGDVFGITSATPHDGALYLGTLFGNRVVRYPLD